MEVLSIELGYLLQAKMEPGVFESTENRKILFLYNMVLQFRPSLLLDSINPQIPFISFLCITIS